ncbi:MAG: chromosome partitioning protein ParB [Desulfobulbaceae bacterium A2]|nr:MAG: chromosome partitioning protein ParB [Desulfobulbaceae bacterium A2]
MSAEKKRALGRGVNALLADAGGDPRFFLCELDRIAANPHQPRRHFDEVALEELASSIRENGILQPLLVSSAASGFTLIAGERRLRAARIAGLHQVPVLLWDDAREDERFKLALIENIQRQDLNPIEEAQAYGRLIKDFGLTQEEAAQRVGKHRATVANVLRLLQLPESIQEDIGFGRMSEGHARVLLRIKDDPARLQEIRDRIVDEGITVRETERLCVTKKTRPEKAGRRRTAETEAIPAEYCKALANQLANQLHTQVRIVQQGGRGRLEIEYFSSDDLERLVALLSGEGER